MSSVLRSLMNKRAFQKKAFVPMTDPAMQASMPGQAPQGAPMDPAMGGAPVGQPPMDPSMGAAPMPPQGGTGDPIVDQLLAMGFQVDPQGNVYDQNGQPVPPEQLQQIAQQIAAQMGGMPPQGAPMDPAMQGAPMEQPPMDPSMGAPMDPNAAPAPEADPMVMMADMINTILDERMSNLDKRISAITDKLDTVRSLLEDILENKDRKSTSEDIAREADEDIKKILTTAQATEAVPPPQMIAPGAPAPSAEAMDQMDLLASLGGVQ